ncbi:MAG TPA: glycogen/starch/alpha-glucan phosphorylase [Steroidobacteraceae bacterium]|jgi:starch phosphorylase|nr:glycogen/starch/alpha-glucan phosphorylase [Steroidobacteraceae bacterium]
MPGNTDPRRIADTALHRRLQRLGLEGREESWIDRYVLCGHLVRPQDAQLRVRFEATARFIRDLVAHRWARTREARAEARVKRVHYLSMEFLLGRTLRNNMMNLAAEPTVRFAMQQEGWDLNALIEEEPDAGLGNGGLGRLAACFLDSLATLQYPAIGYGLRYEYGIFRQSLQDGWQIEHPDDWLRNVDPWEVKRPNRTYVVPLNSSFELQGAGITVRRNRPSSLLGIAYDRPVVGYGGHCINTLRLWAAAAPNSLDFAGFSQGDFAGAVLQNVAAESVTRVLYPDDSTLAGRALRFLQQYFLVSCSVQDIITRFREDGAEWSTLPERVAIQMNDTHPALSVAELMRVLVDEARLPWDEAWDLTVRCLAYTNHTLLPEALERWPVEMFEILIPRHLEIIYEINHRFLDDVRHRFPGDGARAQRMSLIEEGPIRRVRMAHLAVVGSHSTNGVAAIHSELLKSRVLPDFNEAFPARFSNKTNGVTPRRWLQQANPFLSELITRTIGPEWITDLSALRDMLHFVDDTAFHEEFRDAKRAAKSAFASWLKARSDYIVNPEAIFDCQVKRIHEYKRQLLNALHIVVLYNRLRAHPQQEMTPHVFLFAGKAAPAYRLAKLIIKLINNIAATIASDPLISDRLQVLFLPEYNVSMAEQLIPACDISQQISTAGFEASGTSNMKFMMNGALTIGTWDGATIEMAEEAGAENLFLFGLTAQQVADSAGWYDPHWHYANEPETRDALDLIFSDHFSRSEPGVFNPIRDTLLRDGDRFRHLADLTDYGRAHRQLTNLYQDSAAWTRKAIVNVACSGKFSSDRTIKEYADQIWGLAPSPVS